LYGDTNHPVKVKNADLQILEGGLSVSGATTLSSSLNVSGATALSSSLNVSGATTLNATTIDADLQVLGGRIRDKTGPVMPVGSIIAYAGEIFKIGAFDVEAYANANVDDLKGIHQTDQAAEAKYAADMQAWNFFSGKQCPSPPPAPFDLFNHWIVHGINEGRLGFIIDKDGKPYSGFAYGCSQAVDASCIACANPPEGWLLCDGSPIPAAFSELIAVVGGANTPNLCGRTLVGTGRLEDDRHFKKHFNLNDANGEFQHTLTEAEMPKHAHQTDSSIGWQINRVGGDELNLMCQIVGAKTFDTGGGQPHNNMQPYFAVNYIIKC
jgi:microcystin-dependent protein